MTTKKTALITGVTGQDGSLLTEFLLKKKYRIIGVKRLNKDNQPIVEIYHAIGTLKEVTQKVQDNDPDFKGVINKMQNSGSMSISAWRQVSDRGNHTVSLSVRDFDDRKNENSM